MATQYFDEPVTGNAQYRGHFTGGFLEFGEISFSGTNTNIEVTTYFSKVICALLTPKQTSTVSESLFCDLTIASQQVTVSRVINSVGLEFHFPLDEGQIGNEDYENVPLMIAQSAMTLTNFEYYHGVAYGGEGGGNGVIANLGKTTDDGFWLEDIDCQPAADTTSAFCSTSNFSSGTAAVADGDVLIFETEAGTVSGPGDGIVSISADKTVAATSGLVFNYIFIGIY